jgi:nitrite reductase/ring-hydroxylating ferredoxin subunit
VCARTDLPADSSGLGFEVAGRQVAVFLHEGDVHAVDDQCPHAGGSLSAGVIRRGEVTCPWHSFHFDLCTGLNADGLALRILVHRARVREDGTVEVALGKQA